MALKQLSPNVWNVGDTAYTDIYDVSGKGYVEQPVELAGARSDGWWLIKDRRGEHYLARDYKLRRQPSD